MSTNDVTKDRRIQAIAKNSTATLIRQPFSNRPDIIYFNVGFMPVIKKSLYTLAVLFRGVYEVLTIKS